MEEIALVFSSLAGACTAVAMDKIPRRKSKHTVAAASAIESQLHSLRVEKEILGKTITRLYNNESGISHSQRDKLLARYQYQLGSISAKIEKLEIAGRYPDLGAVGESIVSMMDSRLSKLDERLHEISSKITTTPVPQQAEPLQPQEVRQAKEAGPSGQMARPQTLEKPVQKTPPIEKPAPAVEVPLEVPEMQKATMPEPAIFAEISRPPEHVTVELSTLTRISGRRPEFPAEFIKTSPPPVQPEAPEALQEIEVPRPIVPVEPTPLVAKEEPAPADAPKPEPTVQNIQMPDPIRIPEEEEKIEDDDKDLDKIKSEIMRALSKLEQVEVE